MTLRPDDENQKKESGLFRDPKYFLFDIKMLIGEGAPTWQDDPAFIDAYVAVKEHTLVSPFRLFPIFQFAQRANQLDGDFAQVGVYRGGSAKLISSVKAPRKKFYLFDTFEGLPAPDDEVDVYQKGRFADTSEELVRSLMADAMGIEIVKGIFPESARETHKHARYAFVYLDVDIYPSNFNALSFFYPRMVPGGMIIIDDYGWRNTPGIAKSVHDFIEKSSRGLIPIVTTKYQCLLIKDA